MKFLQRKQIVVLSLVLMLVIAGYLQISYNSQFSAAEDPAQSGDVVYVDNRGTAEGEVAESEQEAVTASKETNNYFAQTKMDRENAREEDIETIKSITGDELASKEAKEKAQEKMLKIVEANQKEANIESLIKGKGFSDAIAMFADDGSIDVIVKAPAISKADTAKIADIVVRQGNVTFDKVIIKTMY
ncbi:stage III sporulation protein AH [Ruminiclostridium sufflavum DSM 19573]|uniref:Stage III sporulation protein AH n=1 Tax=Ruminiclostridium sufflavum DSM 19573 TaxID=1121337 RepID=A0A318XJV7_9FIRM|nr:SpoIIIAH-like family protein [Ruminiclostridium sufflavum]PYG86816.1 stage III sporulation protein AH [Ruminiclostridium sufflavum DSM 19573]